MILRLIFGVLVFYQVTAPVLSLNQTCERSKFVKQLLIYGKQLLELYEDLQLPVKKNPSDCILKFKEQKIVLSVLTAMKPLKKYFLNPNDTSSLPYEQLTNNCICIQDSQKPPHKLHSISSLTKQRFQMLKASPNKSDTTNYRNKKSRYIRVRRFIFGKKKRKKPKKSEQPSDSTPTQDYGPGTRVSDLSKRPTANANYGPGNEVSGLSIRPTAGQDFGAGTYDGDLSAVLHEQKSITGNDEQMVQKTYQGVLGVYEMTTRVYEVPFFSNRSELGKIVIQPSPPSLQLKEQMLPRSCADHQNLLGATSNGIYDIFVDGVQLSVVCDLNSDGGGWTVFQKRGNNGKGKMFFYQSWSAYKYGFGEVGKDYWLGNNHIHKLTAMEPVDLRVDLVDFYARQGHATYANFTVGDEASRYIMRHGQFLGGNAGDSLDSGQPFTTHDAPAPGIHRYRGKTCAQKAQGAWWYNTGHKGLWCYRSNLNGPYYDAPGKAERDSLSVIVWNTYRGVNNVLLETEMKIRPAGFMGIAKL